jgi:alkanesulfonate monooxygenase SsuD/methylene tetrahydromethanopterin reductase-like flavin-dependent oxidoreductase (luciferase family)
VKAGQSEIRFGVFGGPFGDWPRLRAFVQDAEALGADSYWIPDHPLNSQDGPDWAVTLAALAVSTERIRLGALVVCPYYRSAVVLARQAADIDRLSSGRLVLGLGLGDAENEFAQMAIPFPRVAVRLAYLRETVEVLRALWSGEPCTYEGHYIEVRDATLSALPVQHPHIPLLIAGGGEQGTLPMVAELADMANLGAYKAAGGAATIGDVRRKLAVLDERCRQLGRSPDSILRSHVALRSLLAPTRRAVEAKAAALSPGLREQYRIAYGLMATPDEAVAIYQELIDAGMRTFILRIWEDDAETVRLFAEGVLPRLNIGNPT